jgi:hypothetical protein
MLAVTEWVEYRVARAPQTEQMIVSRVVHAATYM